MNSLFHERKRGGGKNERKRKKIEKKEKKVEIIPRFRRISQLEGKGPPYPISTFFLSILPRGKSY